MQALPEHCISIAKGQSVRIEISKARPSVLYSGKIEMKDPIYELKSDRWVPLADAAAVKPVKVYASSYSALLECADESLYGFGRSMQGDSE